MSKFIVLMYHSISSPVPEHESGFVCAKKKFDAHIKALIKKGFYFASIDEVQLHILDKKQLPEKSVLITFDDGYMDNYTNAFPILKKYNIPAIIFLVAGLIGKTNQWLSGKQWTTRKLLTWEQIEEMMNNGVSFGCHSLTHKRLTELNYEEQKKELTESKLLLEDHLGRVINFVAYPYGIYDKNTLNLVKETGYLLGFSTHSGFNSQSVDPLIIRRLEVNGNDSVQKLIWKVQFGSNNPIWITNLKYYYQQLVRRIHGD